MDNMNFCEYCGNSYRNKDEKSCSDMNCYWFSHWTVNKDDPEAMKNKDYIEAEIADMNW